MRDVADSVFGSRATAVHLSVIVFPVERATLNWTANNFICLVTPLPSFFMSFIPPFISLSLLFVVSLFRSLQLGAAVKIVSHLHIYFSVFVVHVESTCNRWLVASALVKQNFPSGAVTEVFLLVRSSYGSATLGTIRVGHFNAETLRTSWTVVCSPWIAVVWPRCGWRCVLWPPNTWPTSVRYWTSTSLAYINIYQVWFFTQEILNAR
jgi:hypothetical protein